MGPRLCAARVKRGRCASARLIACCVGARLSSSVLIEFGRLLVSCCWGDNRAVGWKFLLAGAFDAEMMQAAERHREICRRSRTGRSVRGRKAVIVVMRYRACWCRSGLMRGSVVVRPIESLDDDHASATAGAFVHLGIWCFRTIRSGGIGVGTSCREQLASPRDGLGARRICKESIVADAVEALQQNMHEEAANELMRRQRHDLVAAWPFDSVILVSEGDASRVGRNQPAVGDACVGQRVTPTGCWATVDRERHPPDVLSPMLGPRRPSWLFGPHPCPHP